MAEMDSSDPELERRAIDVVRALAMDAPHAASSGHQGTAMALAPLAHVLWTRVLRYDAEAPDWPDRDRFILSKGHASVLLYSMLHLTGYDLSMQDLREFRQWGSRTPGHPERGHTPGVETTTGPLGQGLGNAVGMAMAERFLADRFNRPDATLVDHRTWVLASDGDLMEGVASEAASLAGHLGLGKLIVLYDDNGITIDGPADLAFSENVAGRFEAYGWATHAVADGHDPAQLRAAIDAALADEDRPHLISIKTRIGRGSPVEGTAKAHGGISAEDTDGRVVLSVRDRGPGIAPAEFERVFAPFYRSNDANFFAQGFGIGLAVCKRLAGAMDASIWVELAPEGGSIFSLSLERAEE